jgi:nitrite reductase/ring-hydroxylating ferredoxin subunit
VKADGRWLAVFAIDDGYHAIDNACPHASAPLCDGRVADGKVVCYLHLWEFDIRTGACAVDSEWNVAHYAARTREGRLEVELPE